MLREIDIVCCFLVFIERIIGCIIKKYYFLDNYCMGNLSGTVLKEEFRLSLIKRLIDVFYLKISRFIGFDVEFNVLLKVMKT
jgi:hypothetical protein